MYADPSTFDPVFNIFSTKSLTSARLIEYQFGQGATQNDGIYSYDSRRLNDSQIAIEQSIKTGEPVSAGYLYAVLRAYNATGGAPSGSTNDRGTAPSPSSGSRSSSALAMAL